MRRLWARRAPDSQLPGSHPKKEVRPQLPGSLSAPATVPLPGRTRQNRPLSPAPHQGRPAPASHRQPRKPARPPSHPPQNPGKKNKRLLLKTRYIDLSFILRFHFQLNLSSTAFYTSGGAGMSGYDVPLLARILTIPPRIVQSYLSNTCNLTWNILSIWSVTNCKHACSMHILLSANNKRVPVCKHLSHCCTLIVMNRLPRLFKDVWTNHHRYSSCVCHTLYF